MDIIKKVQCPWCIHEDLGLEQAEYNDIHSGIKHKEYLYCCNNCGLKTPSKPSELEAMYSLLKFFDKICD